MSRPDRSKLATDGGAGLAQNPFGALAGLGDLPAGPGENRDLKRDAKPISSSEEPVKVPEKNRGRVDVLRTTAGRGGKTVTVAKNFTGIGLPEKEALCKKMRAAAGCGGTIKDGAIEIQGDQREVVMRILREAGFRPVQAGG